MRVPWPGMLWARRSPPCNRARDWEIGKPNPVLGEDVHLVVVLGAGQDASPEQLMEFCRGQLADYKIPRSVSFTGALPRNAMGKVARGELRVYVTDDATAPAK